MGRDYSISMTRIIATVMIVSCHMMQYQGLFLAWVLNVGVQIFLCMSGYLYGYKNFIAEPGEFYSKQFKRILIDYYVVFIPIGLVHLLVLGDVSVMNFITGLLTFTTIDGGGHLWYIPYALFCYLLTPMYFSLFERLWERNRVMGGVVVIMLFWFVMSKTFLDYFNSAWINCYLIGFLLGFCKKKQNKKLINKIEIIIVLLAIIIKTMQLYISFFSEIEMDGILYVLFQQVCDFGHVAVGCSIFIICTKVFTKLFSSGYPNSVRNVCDKADKLTYDVYLIHNFIIQGSFSLMGLTSCLVVNIVIICVIVLIAAKYINMLSTYIGSTSKEKAKN